jgi:thiol:disulfide interchange protein
VGSTVIRLGAAAFFLAWLVFAVYGALPPRKLVEWRAIEGASAAAAAEHKPILYDFSASWCGPCKEMERQVFADGEAARLINGNFIPVKVADEDRSPAASTLRAVHDVQSLPTLLVVHDRKGERRLEGFSGRRDTVAFLKQALVPEPPAMADDHKTDPQ